MPWLLSDFGNVSAASAMIAFMRKLTTLATGDHVLFDGFGAGTSYDVLAVEMGRRVDLIGPASPSGLVLEGAPVPRCQ